jgi:hypothetical protein
MTTNTCRECELMDNSISSIEMDRDYDNPFDYDDEYVAAEFELCLREIESSIADGDGILLRSKIYLVRLKHLHNYMILPPEQFDGIDKATGKLLACTFPAEAGLACTPVAPWTAMVTPEDEMLAYKAAEKCLIEELHMNVHVRKIHDCRLPTGWDNDHE